MLRTLSGSIRRTSTSALLLGAVGLCASCASSSTTSSSTTSTTPNAVFVTIAVTAPASGAVTVVGSAVQPGVTVNETVDTVAPGEPASPSATPAPARPTTTTSTSKSSSSTTTTAGSTTTSFTLKSIPISDVTYTVVAGDFLVKIATAYCTNATSIAYANGWADGKSHAIFPGNVIHLPAKICTAGPTPTTTPTATITKATTTTKATTATTNATTTKAPSTTAPKTTAA